MAADPVKKVNKKRSKKSKKKSSSRRDDKTGGKRKRSHRDRHRSDSKTNATSKDVAPRTSMADMMKDYEFDLDPDTFLRQGNALDDLDPASFLQRVGK